ncbi:Oidioi.mRNA.OKI2018_I69.XSR.g13565.t1.cds [Oikopleura dioica]|uniref:Oidioi.mRNA.OKI2018_I69.XSR.g13565.t1.cds n=1 Tax=Oikopleura dioica TaxID=34765 RepID=A0ABN7SBY5_OIKDI|nr:Oidioi.mRNA.OKI2018_I69.XSR.g13565.t1.cds [Oikopleura dioica]
MDPSTEPCYAVTCIAFAASTYLLSIIVAIFGIEGSRRASSDQKTSKVLFWFHHILGIVAFLALILSLIFMASNVLKVCAGLYSSGLTFAIILIGTCLSLVLLLLSLISAVRARQDLRSIEYRHATFY